MIDAAAHVRLARPCLDLDAAARFSVDGLGLDVLFRATASEPGDHDLVMVGLPGASWHLELVGDSVRPTPTEQDLLVVYLGAPADAELVRRLERHGGTRVAQGAYWDRWGVTVSDPDGYRLVLSHRSWSN